MRRRPKVRTPRRVVRRQPPAPPSPRRRPFLDAMAHLVAGALRAAERSLRDRRSPARTHGRRALRAAALAVVALIGMTLGFRLFGRTTADIGPLRFDLSATLAFSGGTEIRVPPLGTLWFDSHSGPIRLTAQLSNVDDQRVLELIDDPAQADAIIRAAPDQLATALRRLIFRAVGSAVLGAIALSLLVYRRTRRVAQAGGLALAVAAASLATGLATFRPQAVLEPRYSGLLTELPTLVGNAQRTSTSYADFESQLVQIFGALGRLSDTISVAPGYGPIPNTIRVLHISDMHDSPAAWPIVRAVAESFAVDMVLDSGDLTEWGNRIEAAAFLSGITTLRVPYLFVRGNQDTAAITPVAVSKKPNAAVLDDRVIVVAGLTIAGIGSPRQGPDQPNGDTAEDDAAARGAGEQLAKTIATYNLSHPPVDIALVHEPATSHALAGSAPLILAGHTHRRAITTLDDDTTLMVQAATGARGLLDRGGPDASFRLSVLYFSPNHTLQAYDDLTIDATGPHNAQLQRTRVNPR